MYSNLAIPDWGVNRIPGAIWLAHWVLGGFNRGNGMMADKLRSSSSIAAAAVPVATRGERHWAIEWSTYPETSKRAGLSNEK